jgi:ribonuclease HI
MIYIEVDGGCRENHGYMGIGVSVFIDGKLNAQISRSNRGSSSLDAELLAIAHALKLAVQMNFNEAYIVTDCSSCIDIINNRVKNNKGRKIILRVIRKIRDDNPRLSITWMNRNSVETAHELSYLAMERYRKRLNLPSIFNS